ncbi:hypothetical protein ACHAXS_007980 [Conticribra weissflogii]
MSTLQQKSVNKPEDAITVVIGKTFETTILPDGSQKITEVTKYKRLNDGFIYTERKSRQVVEDDQSEATSVQMTPKSIQNTPKTSFMSPQTSTRGGFRFSLGSFKNDTTGLEKNEADKKQDDFPELACPSSLTLTNSSSSDATDVHDTNMVVKCNARSNDKNEDFVEEYFYSNEEPSRQSQTPRQRTNGSGWYATQEQDRDEENSIQFVKDKVKIWSPSNPIRKIRHSDHDKNRFPHIKNFFHQDGNGRDSGDFPRIIELEDEESCETPKVHPPSCRDKLRARKYKIIIAAIVAVLAITSVATVFYRTYNQSEEANTYSFDVNTEPGTTNGKDTNVNDAVDAEDVPPPKTSESDSVKNDQSCVKLKIVLSTDNETGNTEKIKGDQSEWSLTRRENDDSIATIASGGSLGPKEKHIIEDCVEPGVYTFHVSDSGGNGLGEAGTGGYYVIANGLKLGVSSFFFHDEEMTFELPFNGDEFDGDKDTACADDFFLAIKTDDKPEETRWNVVDNESGNTLLRGGPYTLPWAVYTKRACLPNGNYTFNVVDSGGDGICCNYGQGFFVLSSDGETIADSNGKYGDTFSTEFHLGNRTSTDHSSA